MLVPRFSSIIVDLASHINGLYDFVHNHVIYTCHKIVNSLLLLIALCMFGH